MDEPTIYTHYVKFAQLVGSPVLSFEDWMRLRDKLFARDREADRIRDQWLASAGISNTRTRRRDAVELRSDEDE